MIQYFNFGRKILFILSYKLIAATTICLVFIRKEYYNRENSYLMGNSLHDLFGYGKFPLEDSTVSGLKKKKGVQL